MASPEAMEKLRAVLDYIPEEAADRLPGDEPEYYDALTRRIHRSVGVKRTVKRRVIVEQPDPTEGPEPEGPVWTPPEAPPEPELPPLEPAVAMAEAVTTVQTAPGPSGAGAGEADEFGVGTEPQRTAMAAVGGDVRVEPEGDDDFFDFGGSGAGDYEPVEGGAAGLSEREWSQLESSPEAEEADIFDESAWEKDASDEGDGEGAAQGEAFEEVLLPEDEAGFGETGVAEGDLEPAERPPDEWAALQPPVEERAAGEAPRRQAAPEAPWPAPAAAGVPQEFEAVEDEEAASGPGESEFEVLGETDAILTPEGEPAFQVNEYTLYHRTQRGAEGTIREAYFFSAGAVADASPAALPENYDVVVHEQTGVPSVRRSPRLLPVTQVAGLGPIMAERLERAGVHTTRDLLGMDAARVAGATGISDRMLRSFQAQAELLQLDDVAPAEAAAMVHAGVRSLDDLRSATPSELAQAMQRAAQEHQLDLPESASATRVRAWQEQLQRR